MFFWNAATLAYCEDSRWKVATRLFQNGTLTIINTGAYNFEVTSMPMNAFAKPHNEEIERLLQRGVNDVVRVFSFSLCWSTSKKSFAIYEISLINACFWFHNIRVFLNYKVRLLLTLQTVTQNPFKSSISKGLKTITEFKFLVIFTHLN